MPRGDNSKKRDPRPDDPHAVEPCEKCGVRHERWVSSMYVRTCKGHRTGGEPCMNLPIRGGEVCHQRHGGNSRQTRAAANKNLERQEAERRLAGALANIHPNPKYANPLEGILWEVAMSAQAVEWYAERIAELTTPDPEGGPVDLEDLLKEHTTDRWGRPIFEPQSRSDLWGANHDGDLALHILVIAWNDERERHVRMCATAIKAGVQERMVALAEQQGRAMVTIILSVVDKLGLSDEQRSQAKNLAAQEMRRLASIEAQSVPA